ncbi:MAG TPA: fibronectin type III domain-containing protein [Candidatus Woesebacteria bacterium]|nr:fibronectin type III domain-containing protein [Candidatus Woesebacteria bacterium]
MSLEYSTIVKRPDKMRIFAIITGLFIGLPLCTFAFFSASSFFARASDEIPRDVSISNIDKSSATIHWTTDKETLSVVEYGLSPDSLTLYAPELESKREHEVDVTLLTPATTYYFQIKHNNTVYDNGGVPWTFTTKTINGAELEQVKGISTRLTPMPTKPPSPSPTVVLSTSSCKETSCEAIQAKLGKGCSAKDYVQCIAGRGTLSPSLPLSYYYGTPIPTATPTPTSVIIDSNLCKLKRLSTLDDNCTKWKWDSIDLSSKSCQEAFDRYIIQCQDVAFDKDVTTDDFYFTDVIYNAATTLKELPITPVPGATIYCRVRAVDNQGSFDSTNHATPWITASKQCK